jgi:hypothetical protein
MPILDSIVLVAKGPSVEFAAVPSLLAHAEGDLPNRSLYEKGIFFRWPERLIETICSATHTYMFFDIYAFEQLNRPESLYEFASKLLLLASRLSACPTCYFRAELNLYEGSTIPESQRTAENLKADCLETVGFLSAKVLQTARESRCLVIIGI